MTAEANRGLFDGTTRGPLSHLFDLPAFPARPPVAPELARLACAVYQLDALRRAFRLMADDGERERAWTYLTSRFPEFENASAPDTGDPDE